MRHFRDFLQPKALGAPTPLPEIPVRPSRMIHFFDPSNERMVAKVPAIAEQVDILLGNLEDAIPVANKAAARSGMITVGQQWQASDKTQLWVRVNSIDSPWFLDDLTELVTQIGHQLDVIMVPKVQGPWDLHFVDQLLALLEAKAQLTKPILIHAILETASGVAQVEAIAQSSARLQGMSLGPADLAASRRMKTTRVGGGHPGYVVRSDLNPDQPDLERPAVQQDLWHYTLARMVDACAGAGILPFYGPFGDIADTVACEDQFRNAFLMGCVGAWSLHPVQINIARQVFSPPVNEVLWAKQVLAAMPDGSGAVMIDGKMQDDATYKQCHVMVDLAKAIAQRDEEYQQLYGF